MSENNTDESCGVQTLSERAVLGWLELGCWTMVALSPFLYWVNGPAVSTDQLVVRSGLVGFALGGGLALRLTAMLRRLSLATHEHSGEVEKPETVEQDPKS